MSRLNFVLKRVPFMKVQIVIINNMLQYQEAKEPFSCSGNQIHCAIGNREVSMSTVLGLSIFLLAYILRKTIIFKVPEGLQHFPGGQIFSRGV